MKESKDGMKVGEERRINIAIKKDDEEINKEVEGRSAEWGMG